MNRPARFEDTPEGEFRSAIYRMFKRAERSAIYSKNQIAVIRVCANLWMYGRAKALGYGVEIHRGNVAKRAKVSEKTVSRTIKHLVENGCFILTTDIVRGRSNPPKYEIDIPELCYAITGSSFPHCDWERFQSCVVLHDPKPKKRDIKRDIKEGQESGTKRDKMSRSYKESIIGSTMVKCDRSSHSADHDDNSVGGIKASGGQEDSGSHHGKVIPFYFGSQDREAS